MATEIVTVVSFTNGREIQPIVFKPNRDDEDQVAFITRRMAENGWLPIKDNVRRLVLVDGQLEERSRILPAGFARSSAFLK